MSFSFDFGPQKKKKKSKTNKIEKIVDDSVQYGAEYAAEDALETGIAQGVVAGVESGFESFVVNSAEEAAEDVLTSFLPTEKNAEKIEKTFENQKQGGDSPSFAFASPTPIKPAFSNSPQNPDDTTADASSETLKNPNDKMSDDSKNVQKNWTKPLINAAKLAIVALVLYWIATRLRKDWAEISKYDWRPRYGWLTASGFLYLTAFFPAAYFWYLSLRWLGQKTSFFTATKAFYVSQLGKYLPGKAMVVVMRSGMVAGEKVKSSVAAVCVFYETLTMMATGAFLSALVVFIWFREHYFFSLMALGTLLVAGLPLLPPFFIRLLSILRIGKNDPEIQTCLKNLTFRSLFVGFGLMSLLWIGFGLALWAAILGLGIQPGPFLTSFPRYVSATALAIVLGFAVPISPGGLGVREAALTLLLIPYFETVLEIPNNATFTMGPEALATIVSLIQRIVSIVAELGLAAAFFIVPIFVKTFKIFFPPLNRHSEA